MYLYILQKERIIKYKKITNNTNNKNEKKIKILDKQITNKLKNIQFRVYKK